MPPPPAPTAPAVELQPMLASGGRRGGDPPSSSTGLWEVDPPPAPPPREMLLRTAATNLALIALWYFFSTCLSLWNRTLLGRGHGVAGRGAFPAPMLMTALQFGVQILLARLALALGVERRERDAFGPRPVLTWRQYGTQVVPNGMCTGLDIGLSNFSLSLITLSFYTMCKSTTPLFLLLFAFVWGLEKPSWSLAGVVAIICTGLLLLVYGETAFDGAGFALVMTASALSGLRWTITQVLLQGVPGGGSDGHAAPAAGPVHVLAALTPVMALTVGAVSLAAERLWVALPGSPYFDSAPSALLTLALVAGGALIAFAMVWVEFTVIKATSALTFMVAGTFKEIVTVLAAVAFLHESFSPVNAAGLTVLIAGVALFNYQKWVKVRDAAGGGAGGGGRKTSCDALGALEAGAPPRAESTVAPTLSIRTRNLTASTDEGGAGSAARAGEARRGGEERGGAGRGALQH